MRPASAASEGNAITAQSSSRKPNIRKSLCNINTLLIFVPFVGNWSGSGHRRTVYRARSMHIGFITAGLAFAEKSIRLSDLGKA
jgi:hypothetical protein